LVISIDHALTQGAAWGHSPEEEIAFLVVHGLLHLAGWRDDTEKQRARMLARQHDLIDRWRQQPACEGR
jgi:rRNA maturation RNase YbeY